ncbi:ADP-ribosylation factor-related protein 1-like isoform X2 [Anneissia japonica]|nr:ADP-ribosylation factor-related protein 1-like isoform X2 [Anneissia japonica]XP_033097948.1 ADP-ribosylation factor-related protein 1-like isoform X2 [Anneissia japonica]XP_033097949.1 ADP-ribosylation factor-related protein 1-like isoform X2 [Anneissia japonica]XP_033097950.1 ADP-ribosylation factor-related protein 1-like isoform X2 [Anneissia japonica]
MFALLSGLWKFMFRKDEYYILILGLDNAGKTTFLEQSQMQFDKNYKGGSLEKITTTVGLNIGKIDRGHVRLNFWDLGGQEELQALWDKYYAESHGVIYVIDSSDKSRIEESRLAFDEMLEHETLAGVPLLVLVNKQDVDGCLTVATIKEMFHQSVSKIGKRDCHVQAISAKTGDGIYECIDWMKNMVVRNSIRRPPTEKDIT